MDCPHQHDDNVCYRCQERQRFFDFGEEDAIHDAFLMIVSPETDYENIEDVLVGESSYDQDTLDHWKEYLSEE